MNERINNSLSGNDRGDADRSDEGISELLREVGARDLPPVDAVNDVRRAVYEEWQAIVTQRRRRDRRMVFALAAGLAAVAVAIGVSMRITPQPAAAVAEVARVDGALQIAVDEGDEWHTVDAGTTLTRGALLRTDQGTRAALDFGRGLSVRIDAGSLVEIKSADRITLDGGAVYVDADPRLLRDPQSVTTAALVVDTGYGQIHHVGTQYEVRVVRNAIQVSIREGRIEFDNADHHDGGAAGEQLLIAQEGTILRSTVSPQDSRWQWASGIAPVFDIERQPLSQFLDWVARETGKQIEYSTPDVRTRAEQLILRGSVNNLAPEQALAAVLATTPFSQSQTASTIRIQL
jgi:ferric-dicitrate binding protein FerR (iron transport regulator)